VTEAVRALEACLENIVNRQRATRRVALLVVVMWVVPHIL
jgi:hypothetical protein